MSKMNLLLLFLFTSLSPKADFAVVRVIWTSDLHSQLVPTTDFASAGMPRRKLGGMSGLIKLIQELKTPATLLLDNGDFAFGSPEGDSSQGRVMTYFMNRLGYQAAVLGARDFQDGLVNIELLARSAGFPLLADPLLNVLLNRQSSLFQPYLVREVYGVRVGIIGVLDPQIQFLNRQASVAGLVVDDPLIQVRRLLPAVTAESAEIVIVLGHISVEQGRVLAESLPGIDLIICQGEPVIENQLPRSGKAGVVVAGAYGQRLGVADILFHKTERRVYTIETEILNVQPENESDPAVQEMILSGYDTTVAFSVEEYFPDEFGRWRLALTIAEALREENNADLAILPVSVVEAGLSSGPITRRELFNSAPYQERLRLITVPESVLNRLLNPVEVDRKFTVPAVAGADLFVIGDTSGLPVLNTVAGIRLRARKIGDYKVVIPEGWLEKSKVEDKGKLLPYNLTQFWLNYAETNKEIVSASRPRFYPATIMQVQQLQENKPGLININTADEETLCQLPGIGPKTAQRIVEYRQRYGKFNSVAEIMNVRGIGPKKFEQIKNLITVR